MKIHKLRFKNLNSLKGEFTINFDRNPLSQAGLFAITGPTGAGKTTILDAICVALYGQTPRLGTSGGQDSRVVKARVEELMTRHTADCYAEVEFAARGRCYRSSWLLRRSRGRADGRFQPEIMELAEITADSPPLIIEKGKREVPARVGELTGLDFLRFTRSVMLAQGSFATFLNARDNERADLLEKMTGTEIYSLISQETHQRAGREKQELDKLNLLKESIKLMDQHEREELSRKAGEIREKSKVLQETLTGLEIRKGWLERIQRLEEAVRKGRQELEQVDRDFDAAGPDLERLARAFKALPLKGDFDLLESLRKQVLQLSQGVAALERDIPLLEQKLNEEEQARHEEQQRFEDFKKEFEDKEKLLSETIQKDQQIRGEQKVLTDRQKILTGIDRSLAESEKAKGDVDNEILKATAEIERLKSYLDARAIDGELVRDLPLLRGRLSDLARQRAARSNRLGQLADSQKKVDQLAKEVRQNRDRVELGQRQHQANLEGKVALEAQLQEKLMGKSLDEWEHEERQLERQQTVMERLVEIGKAAAEAKNKINENSRKREAVQKELEFAQEQSRALTGARKEEEIILTHLQEKQRLELLVAKYEDDRKNLKAGEPCPLCGSLEHPWEMGRGESEGGIEKQGGGIEERAGQGAPEAEGTEELVARQKRKIDGLEERIREAVGHLAELGSQRNRCGETIEEQTRVSASSMEKWDNLAPSIAWKLPPAEWQILQERGDAAVEELRQLQGQLCEMKKMKSDLDNLSEEVHAGQKEQARLELLLQQIISRREQAEADGKRQQQELELATSEMKALEKTLTEKLITYQESVPEEGREQELEQRLKLRCSRYQETQEKVRSLEQDLIPLGEKKSSLEGRIQAASEQRKEEMENIRLKKDQLDVLTRERKGLLGDDDPEEVRKNLKKRQSSMEKRIRELEAQAADLKSDLHAKSQLLASQKADLIRQTEEQEKVRACFSSKREAAGFPNEQSLREALLPREEMERLEAAQKQLEQRKIQAKTRLEDALHHVALEREKPLTEESLDAVRQKIGEHKAVLENLHQQLGIIQASLQQQEDLLRQQQKLMEKIEVQEKECRRWDSLNKLIGSADGKKFRRYAQGLTLDYLISLANRYLVKLNDRYLLQRKGNEELGLEVVDTYQAGVTRPTSTLSGGETFLASLALALGLSGLASRNTSIDSLFLDEGFGTLDAESLEVALAALDSLNAAGKTIGIISHVEVLKERIPTQIQVHKLSGGYSALEIVS